MVMTKEERIISRKETTRRDRLNHKKQEKIYREKNRKKIREINRLYQLKNKLKIKEKKKRYYQTNKKAILLKIKQRYLSQRKNILKRMKKEYYVNPEKKKQQVDKYRLKNLSNIRKSKRMTYQMNRDKILAQSRRSREKNKDHNRIQKHKIYVRDKKKIIEKVRIYRNIRRKKDIRFNLTERLRALLIITLNNYTLHGKVSNSHFYGIHYQEIVSKLSMVAPKKLREDFINQRTKYHIDHIIPCRVLQFVSEENIIPAIQLIFHPDNLQWLPAEENLKKNRTIPQFDSLPEPTKQIAIQLKPLLNHNIFTTNLD